MSVLDKAVCLKLNGLWQRMGYITVKEAVIAMNGMVGGTPPALALDIALDEKGNMTSARAVGWDEWVTLPVRGSEPAIAAKSGAIRAPLVIIDPQFVKMPLKARKLTSRAIHERDGYVDQYTNEKLRPEEASVDHVIPKDVWNRKGLRGSPNTWTNMVTCKKDRNFKKGNKLNAKAGLVLQRKPKAPKPVPVSCLVTEPKYPIHAPFFT